MFYNIAIHTYCFELALCFLDLGDSCIILLARGRRQSQSTGLYVAEPREHAEGYARHTSRKLGVFT